MAKKKATEKSSNRRVPKKKDTDTPLPAIALRKRAEALLRAKPAEIPTLPTADVQAIVHELTVHQMELDIQNEELRQAQVELSHSRDRYFDLYECAPVGYVTLGRDGNIIEANLTAAAMLGVERPDLLRGNIAKFVDRESQDDCFLHRRAVFTDETKQIRELNMRKADGTLLRVRLESIAFGGDHQPQCRTALIDLTSIKHTRQQLEESEQRYRRLTDAVTDYIYRARVERGRAVETIHEANCETVTGYMPAEFRADSMLWISMVPPEDRASVEQQAARILSAHNAPPSEHRIRRKDGQLRWVLHIVSPQHDDQGQLISYDGLLRDITERKEAEESLRQLNETLEQRVAERTREVQLQAKAIANLGEGVVITSDDVDWPGPQIIFVNEAACRITGYDAEELIGQTPRILQGHDTDRKALDEMKQLLAAGEPVLFELVNYRKDGSPFDAELFISAMYDAEGNHTNFIAIYRDISDRKELQKQVLEIAAEEDRRIGYELHDNIQQQLTGLGLLAASLSEALEVAAAEEAHMAGRLAEGIKETVHQVHLLSRGLVPVDVDAEGLRAGLTDLASRISEQYGVDCRFRCDGPVQVADNFVATHVYRIAQEAVNNAIKHGRSERIELSLTGVRESITLQVFDNGVGIGDKRVSGPGMGLRIIDYRAGLIGATVHIAQGKDGGTMLSCTVRR